MSPLSCCVLLRSSPLYAHLLISLWTVLCIVSSPSTPVVHPSCPDQQQQHSLGLGCYSVSVFSVLQAPRLNKAFWVPASTSCTGFKSVIESRELLNCQSLTTGVAPDFISTCWFINKPPLIIRSHIAVQIHVVQNLDRSGQQRCLIS